MKNGRILLGIVGVTLGLAFDGTCTEIVGSPYRGIAERNAFGLHSAPSPQRSVVKTPTTAFPEITLTGITTILGNKMALMKLPARTKLGTPLPTAAEESLVLAEGQREGEIEVLEIDEKVGTVKVKHAGSAATLSFAENGVKLTASTPPGPAGSIPFALPANGITEPATGTPPAAVEAETTPARPPAVTRPTLPLPGMPIVQESQLPTSLITRALSSAGNVVPGTWRRSARPVMAQ